MKTLALALLIGFVDAAGAMDLEPVARDLVYCSTVADAFSRNSAKMGEYRDFLLGSAAALTSDQFVASERPAALARVEAKLAGAKQSTEGGGQSQPNLDTFMEDLKHCSHQVLEHQDEIAAGLRKLRERRH